MRQIGLIAGLLACLMLALPTSSWGYCRCADAQVSSCCNCVKCGAATCCCRHAVEPKADGCEACSKPGVPDQCHCVSSVDESAVLTEQSTVPVAVALAAAWRYPFDLSYPKLDNPPANQPPPWISHNRRQATLCVWRK